MIKRLTFEYVYNYFKENGCELLETEYKNTQTSLKYKCKCGHVTQTAFTNFKKKKRCRNCVGREKHTYQYIFDYFKNQNCELLEKEYKNVDTKMKYKCKCGNISEICFDKFRIGGRCKICSKTQPRDFEYVYNYFKEQGCELLETEYINASTRIKYKCKCNNISYTTFNNFQKYRRCKNCGTLSMYGENNPSWNSNREEIKLNQRIREYKSKIWKIRNMKDDSNYNNFLKYPKKYHLDHIIPVFLFSKLVLEYNLDEQKVKKVINHRSNFQLLTKEENHKKHSKGNIFEAAQLLMLNGFKLINNIK